MVIMQRAVYPFVLYLFFANNTSSNILQDPTDIKKSNPNIYQKPIRDISIKCEGDGKSIDRSLDKKTKLMTLIDIESTDYIHPSTNISSNLNGNLFFIESSGRNYLRPRDACAIESAVKNSGISGRIVVAMTSPYLDILANNATYQIYTKFAEKLVFFRFVNVHTIFLGTPLYELHVKGRLLHHKEKNTIVQYR